MLQSSISNHRGLEAADGIKTEASIVEIHQGAIERVLAVMRRQFADPLSLNDMADIACLSPYYFNRVFHRVIGLPPCEFLGVLRLDAAKRLLLTTDLSVTDICFSVGYNALGSFTSRFTQQIGLSPRHLRSRIRDFSGARVRPIDETLEREQAALQYSSLAGRIETPGLSEGLIYVGLFSKPIPQGKPISCTMLTGPGPFRLGLVPPGWYYLLAAAFPLSRDPRNTLLLENACLVGIHGPIVIQDRKICPIIELCLRPPHLTDPPILTALL